MMNRPTFLLCAGLLCGAALVGFSCDPKPGPPTPPPTTLAPPPTPAPECFAPVPIPGQLGDYEPFAYAEPIHLEEVRAAMLAVEVQLGADYCKVDPYEKILLVAAELRLQTYCAAAEGDRVFVLLAPDSSTAEEYHPVRYTDGCWTTAKPKTYLGRLKWNPTKKGGT